jgi:hypothetical protein
MTRVALLAIALAACGGAQAPATGGGGSGSAEPVAHDTRTPFEKRRDAACRQLAPKLTACAAEDAKADLDAGKTTPEQYKQDTNPKVLEKNTDDFIDKCTGWRDMSSRQLRVLEVCFKEETDCGPLRACLANLQPK